MMLGGALVTPVILPVLVKQPNRANRKPLTLMHQFENLPKFHAQSIISACISICKRVNWKNFKITNADFTFFDS